MDARKVLRASLVSEVRLYVDLLIKIGSARGDAQALAGGSSFEVIRKGRLQRQWRQTGMVLTSSSEKA